MGIREAMNRHPGLTVCVVVPVVLLTIGIAAYLQLPETPPKPQTRIFFTVDDGKTYFADKMDKIAPFEKDGKEAVVARVFRCGNQQPFVAYLERIEPEAKKRIDELTKHGVNAGNAPQIGMLQGTSTQRKKPGDSKWIKITDGDPQFEAMTKVACQDGKPGEEQAPEIP